MVEKSGTNSNYGQGEMSSFREWLKTYEREQQQHSNQIAGLITGHTQLSSEVAQISANVQTLLNTQKGLYDRLNRPWQWGAVIAAFAAVISSAGIFGTILTLTIKPIEESVYEINTEVKEGRHNQMDINMWLRDQVEGTRIQTETNRTDIEWFKKIEGRLHDTLIEE